MRDITLEDTFYMDFTTRAFATGIPGTLGGTPVLSVLEENNATPITAGVSVSVDRASVAGLNMATIVATAANGYEAGKGYSVYISTGTVGGVSVVGEVVGQFTIGTIPDAVWDEVLTGATHNVTNSAARRLRVIQESGSYEGGAVWIDTTANGTAGTTNFENGVDILPVDSIGDANTIATSVGLSRFVIAPGSSITFAATQANQEFIGDNWTLALGGQSISGSHILGADVTGTATGATEFHFNHCEMGACTLAGCHLDDCDLEGIITLSAAADYFFINCVHAGGTATIDFGAAIGSSTVHVHGYNGALTIKNMGTGDTLHFDSAGGKLTLDNTNDGGTVNLNGTFDFSDSSTGMTINKGGAVVETVDAIKTVTDKMVFTKANELDVNTKSINEAEVVGDGNATPWDGA